MGTELEDFANMRLSLEPRLLPSSVGAFWDSSWSVPLTGGCVADFVVIVAKELLCWCEDEIVGERGMCDVGGGVDSCCGASRASSDEKLDWRSSVSEP